MVGSINISSAGSIRMEVRSTHTKLLIFPDDSQESTHLDLIRDNSRFSAEETKFNLVIRGGLFNVFRPAAIRWGAPKSRNGQGMRNAIIVNIDRIGREEGVGMFMALCTAHLALVTDGASNEADQGL